MKIEWTERAVADLQSVSDYISTDSPLYARRMAERIIEGVESLDKFPEKGHSVPETSAKEIREIWVNPFRIIYRLVPEKVVVLTIVHGRRDFHVQELKFPPTN